MPIKTTAYPLAETWTVAAKYTAAAEIAVAVGNSDPVDECFFVVGDDDTVPAVVSAAARIIPPFGERHITLAAGERLWLCGYNGNTATVSW